MFTVRAEHSETEKNPKWPISVIRLHLAALMYRVQRHSSQEPQHRAGQQGSGCCVCQVQRPELFSDTQTGEQLDPWAVWWLSPFPSLQSAGMDSCQNWARTGPEGFRCQLPSWWTLLATCAWVISYHGRWLARHTDSSVLSRWPLTVFVFSCSLCSLGCL